jgi:UDP-N-acetylglucosamine transferase subunit ALG13
MSSISRENDDRPLLVVTVGSDHHPFDRIIDWLDEYLVSGRADRVRYVCQHGTSHAPRFGFHQPYIEHDVLQSLLADAAAVVCHGGPSSLLETLRCGRIPLAVPREAESGEAVDDHQRAFCELLASRHQALLANTRSDLHCRLDEVLACPAAFAAPPLTYDADRKETVERFATLVAGHRPRRRSRVVARACGRLALKTG